MAERPGGPAGRNGDDDFDWMYGDGASPDRPAHRPPPPPAGNNPEPTRMLPAQPRDRPPNQPPPARQRPAPASAAPSYAPPVPPPSRTSGGRSGGPSRWSRPRTWITLVLVLILLWLVYVVAVPLWTWSRVDKVAFEPDGDRPDDQPGTTYLMIGNDSRANLSEEEVKKYHTGDAEQQPGSLADTILMLHTGSGPDVLLSFPRDWIIDGHKINGLWDPGDPTALVKALEQQTGIRIDEYVEVGLGGVAGIVDAVGGITICPKEKLDDKLANLHVKKGCQNADGAVALAYARSRHSSALGDLDRVQRQREVVAAVGKKVLSPWSVVNPVRWWRLNQAVPDFFAFGEGTGPIDIGRWALAMSSVGDDGLTCTMPVTDGSANTLDEARGKPLFDAISEDQTDDITKKQCTASGVPGS